MFQRVQTTTKNKLSLLAVSVAAAMAHQAAVASEAESQQDDHKTVMIEVKGQATGGIDSLITAEDLEKTTASNLGEIFQLDPQINAGGSVGMGQKLYLRNIGEDALNISVDGAEQAGSAFHHSGRVAVEPDLLKQVEVEAGAGNASAGFGALGGAVRFVTKDPSDLLRDGETAGALVKGTYYSNTEGFKTTVSVFGRDETDTMSILASFVRAEHENAEDGNGDEIKGSESGQRLGYVKLVTNLSDAQKLSVSYEKLKEDGDILYKPDLIASARNVPEPTQGWRDTAILNYQYNPSSDDMVDLSVNLYNTANEQEREFRGTSYDGAVETYGATVQNISRIRNIKMIYGLNYRDDKSYLNDVDFANPHFEENGRVRGLFLQNVVEVTHDLTVSAGVRYDDYELEDVNDQDFNDNKFSPNISANYDVTDYLSFSLGYAEAFRGPEVKDSFKLSSSSNAADLDAEESKNIELGMDFSMGSFGLAAGVYKHEIHNPIGGVFPWSRVSENLEDDIETIGYYVKADYVWDRLTAMISYHSADTEADDVTTTRYIHGSTAASKGDTLVTDVSYEVNHDLMLGWTAEYVKGIHDIDIELDDDAGEPLKPSKPGYGVHDLYARWLPTSDEDFSLTFTVKNLFDKQYLDHTSVENLTSGTGYESIVGSPEAGRDIRVTAALRI
ncbi:TonB-dependent receptor domain-containing protein [Litoribrevibacter albus]|uniref:TonB-dependent heme/hemoglobin receptor family protein n=1 Tax=Litoribrevibacter albus TaxID=1473156 RepID=A0AA37SEE9_9GAMM|nr:TonB-dependent receptor [Litoribrevibacter albus]GLQ32852.1 TonB-dependent heme/hemoglobin receptor family protein [Litoribrevibacter albus]